MSDVAPVGSEVVAEQPAGTPSGNGSPPRSRNALRYGVAFAIGSALATLLFVHTLTTGTFGFSARVPFGDDFYDVQARRLFDGRWDMPLDVVAVEGYRHEGKLYMYFGPVPAFLRMPVLAALDPGDGEYTKQWMTTAFAVALAAAGCLGWQVRRLARADAPCGWVETAAVAAGAFTVGAGSTLLYLGSGPWVYHEAILWGVAFTFAAFAALLAWLHRPRFFVLGLAGLLTAAAVGSRLSVGVGPVAALGLLAAVVLAARLSGWVRRAVAPRVGLRDEAVTWPVGGTLAGAAVLPLVLYAWLNTRKFGTLFSVPYHRQLLNLVQANRYEVLAANDDTLFRVDAVPSALYQYFRPDALGFRSEFPWLQFPTWKPSVFGGLLYDHLDRTGSVPTSMPSLLALALLGVGAVALARPRVGSPTLAALRLPLLGAAGAVVPSLAFVFLTQRYLGDLLPLLVLAASAGFFAVVGWAVRRAGAWRVLTALVAVSLLGLGAFGVLANYGMARDWQREHLPPEQIFPADRRWR